MDFVRERAARINPATTIMIVLISAVIIFASLRASTRRIVGMDMCVCQTPNITRLVDVTNPA